MVSRGLFAAICALLLVASAFSQSVSYKRAIPGSVYRSVFYAIDDSPKSPLPDLKNGEIGTFVMISGSFHDSDVSIVTGKKAYNSDQFLALGRRIAKELGRPNTDLIISTGRRLRDIDLEFNDYLKLERYTSRSTTPIGRIMRIVASSDLPRPIAWGVRDSDLGMLRLNGTQIKETSIYLLSESKPDDVVTFEFQRHWYGLVAIVFFGTFLSVIFVSMPILIIRSALRSKPTETTEAPPMPATLDEAQQKYEIRKQHKFKWRYLGLLIPFVMFFGVIPYMDDGFMWIPDDFSFAWAIIPIAMIFLSTSIASYIRKKRGIDPPAVERVQNRLKLLMLPFFVMFGLFFLLTNQPQIFQNVPLPIMRALPFVILGGSLLSIFLVGRRGKMQSYIRLKAGDPDFDAAMEFAKKARVRVSRVEINKNMTGINAAATLFGRVFVTEGLREKLTKEERRAIIAHEIGHIKGQHVPIFMLLGFLFIAVLIFTAHELRDLAKNGPHWLLVILDSPALIWIPQVFFSLVILSPLRRRAEFFADRFALTQTQDYALFATALAKIHLLNGSPHTFTSRDERIASHPSLTKRLDSLRAVAQSLGLPIDDSQVEALFHGPTPSAGEPTLSM